MAKKQKVYTFALLMSLAVFAAAGAVNIGAQAQGQATVAFLTSIGGTTNPTGTQTYPDGQTITITATPTDPGYVFSNWVILAGSTTTTSTDNPTSLSVSGGTTYAVQAVFTPVLGPPGGNLPDLANMPDAAIVVVLAAAGGSTTPPPGTYALANATKLNLQANAASGWTFSHWVISGPITGHGSAPLNLEPTDNPYNVNHGYGATYYYQPVFTQSGGASPGPSPTIPEFSEAAAAVLAVALVAVAVGTFAYKRKK